MNKVANILLLIVAFTLTYSTVNAQKKKKKPSTVNRKPSTANRQPSTVDFKDTTAPKEVTITSSFKPSLRNAAKVNFTAATPIIDTNKLPLSYNIPSSNLFFSYQPVAIKPVALFVDTSIDWHSDAYLKLGFGNFSSPYAEAGIAFGDGKQTMFSLHGKHTSSKGSLAFQDFSKTGINFLGSITTKKNNEITAKAYWDNSTQYRYGYQPSTLVFAKDDLRQAFNTVGIEIGLQNKEPNSFGITYHPQIKASTFFDNREGNEISLLAKLPINKSFGRLLALDVAATADISTFKRQLVPNAVTINNNLFYVNPTIQFKTPNLKLHVGVQPTWDNQSFWLLPNITAEAKISEEKFVVQAGWRGYVNKNTYQLLAGINPYITQPTSLLNTKLSEQYAGFKGSAGKHFTYNARISFLNMDNAALYVNDTTSAKTQEFKTVFEPVLKAIMLHGEIGYTDQEKFSFIASANYTQFTKLNTYDKAYGLLPLEINGALRWKVFKDLLVKADVFFWDGSSYQMQNLKSGKLNPAVDANIGTEFTVMPKLNVWLQLNNTFNNKYQRWNQYEALGLQVLGGIVYRF
ncbi:MAG: hypothetical protein QM541_11295 [Flavobacterium sp.]|nr:hypothetical protein [Flavobacterium sp.]